MQQKHKRIVVLLVEDNPGDATLVRGMLLEASGSPFSVQWARDLSSALERIASTSFDVVLLDMGLPDSSGLETFTRLQQAAPALPVIVLSGDDDESFALSAVRAGAEDYLVKGHVPPEALSRCVRYTVERNTRRSNAEESPHAHKPRGKVLGLLGAKGGVGTTTVAVNVAAALAGHKHGVIAVELRGHYGTMAHHFGQETPHSNLSGLLDLAPDQVTEIELNSKIVKYSSTLRALFGPQQASQSQPIPAEHARILIETLARMSQFVVLDLPPEPSEANQEALRACDFVGLLLDREASCLAAAKVMSDHLRGWGIDALVGAVIVHRSPLACPVDLDDVTGELGLGIIGLIPPAADACLMAQKGGVPVVDSFPEALIGDSLQKLASKLAEDPIVIRKTA